MTTPIRLLSWNVKMLPPVAKIGVPPFGIPRGWWELCEGGVADPERAKRIGKVLAKGDWDVIVLQELFDEDARAVIRKALEKKGYATHGPFGNDLFNDDSGLFIASKIEVTATAFHEYGAKAGADALVDKGVCGALLRTNARWGTKVHSMFVFGTHLQAGEENQRVRDQQLGELRRFLSKSLGAAKDSSRVSALALGDFNVVAESPSVGEGQLVPTSAYRGMLERLERPRDLYRLHHVAAPGYTFDGNHNTMTRRSEGERERIDYAFALDYVPSRYDETQPSELAKLECLEASVEIFRDGGHDLSDHYAVSVTLSPS